MADKLWGYERKGVVYPVVTNTWFYARAAISRQLCSQGIKHDISKVGKGIYQIPIVDISQKNKEGMTFDEWLRVSERPAKPNTHAAWLAGEDPTEWRKPNASAGK